MADYGDWQDRLHIYGLDLRDLASVKSFCALVLRTYTRLDFIVNNAAQTVRRPPAYYKHLMPTELVPTEALPAKIRHLVKGDAHSLHLMQPHLYLENDAKVAFITPADADADADIEAASPSTHAPSLHAATPSPDPPVITPVTTPVTIPTPVTTTTTANAPTHPGPSLARNPLSSTSGVVLTSNETQNKSAALSQLAVAKGDTDTDASLFPSGRYDVTGQQLDLRKSNSWTMVLDEVDPAEAIECMAINSMSPFILNGTLKPLMMKDTSVDKFIINVSAMEGKFYRHKGPQHPHTNMAKAALNMLTRTSAQDYATHRIYMNSVDTGWINDENPHDTSQRIAESNNFQTPIDEMDAMARVLDPILDGLNGGGLPHGLFIKDFMPTEW
jgi:NAD(P)-dependent dehydrogenase (short-subunit alcohol dehydrogenase family)